MLNHCQQQTRAKACGWQPSPPPPSPSPPPGGRCGDGTTLTDGECVVKLGDGTTLADGECQIDCSGSPRRLSEAPEEADTFGPHAEPAGRELVKTLLEDHPELGAFLVRGEDGTVATDMLDKLLQFYQLFGQPALA